MLYAYAVLYLIAAIFLAVRSFPNYSMFALVTILLGMPTAIGVFMKRAWGRWAGILLNIGWTCVAIRALLYQGLKVQPITLLIAGLLGGVVFYIHRLTPTFEIDEE